MQQILSIIFDPVLFGLAIGIVFIIETLKPFLRKIHIDSSSEYRLLLLILSIFIVVNFNNEWINAQLIKDSKLATVIWLTVLASIIYDFGLKGLMTYFQKILKKQLDDKIK